MKSTQKSAIYSQIAQAHEAYKAGNLSKAQALYEETLTLDPSNFDTLHMLGVVYAQMNQPQKAIELLKKASFVEPNHAILQFNLANAYRKAGNQLGIAKEHFEQAIKLDPHYLDALINLGDLYLELHETQLAINCFLEASKTNPVSVQAQLGLGRSYMAADNNNFSKQAYEKAFELSIKQNRSTPSSDAALGQLMDIGTSFHILGSFEKALQVFNKVLDARPNYEKALFHKAIAYRSMNQLNEALDSFNELYQLNSESLDAIQGMAVTFLDIGRKEEALVCCKRALELSPDLGTAHDTMGVVLNSLKNFHQSIQHHLRAIELNPHSCDFYINLGFSLLSVNQIQEAKIAFSEAIRLDPKAKKASWNLSAALLKLNEFEDGWKHYAARWDLPELNLKPLSTEKPSWSPSCNCKHLLVWGEQGIGDEIMFISLLDQLSSNIAQVTVYLEKRLIPLIQRSFPNIRCLLDPSELETLDYDHQISIGDLAKYYCNTPNDFAKIRVPYLLSDQTVSSQIASAYKKENKVLCGISWKSNNPKLGADRSIELKEMLSIINIPEFEFINLQYGDVAQDIKSVQQELGINILQAKEVNNFSDIDGFAALVNACGLIISIDNSTVHIAGALGKPVWILLNTNPDWRWFLDRTDSLWYPSATLFRQQTPGNWQTVLNQVKDKAIAIINSRPTA